MRALTSPVPALTGAGFGPAFFFLVVGISPAAFRVSRRFVVRRWMQSNTRRLENVPGILEILPEGSHEYHG